MINIRKATINDIDAIVNIKIDGWKIAYKDILDKKFLDSMDYVNNYNKFKIEIEQSNSNKVIFVIETDNIVVGYAKVSILKNDEYDSQISVIYIKPDVKNKGYGTLLINYIKDYLKNKKCKNMILWCIDKNEPSKAFYRKRGGKEGKKIMSKMGEQDILEVSFIFEL